jgi:hypothetical protein
MVINLSSLPQEIINEYGLLELAHDDRVYIEIQKGMHGLSQADILENELLQRRLALDGYRRTDHTHGLWKHETHPVWFLLVVDYFGINYIGHDNAEHLVASINNNYDISSDWTGSAYCGLKLEWEYVNGTTADTADKIIKLLNYCTTYPEATLYYHASDMILNIHSDASHLSEREAKS